LTFSPSFSVEEQSLPNFDKSRIKPPNHLHVTPESVINHRIAFSTQAALRSTSGCSGQLQLSARWDLCPKLPVHHVLSHRTGDKPKFLYVALAGVADTYSDASSIVAMGCHQKKKSKTSHNVKYVVQNEIIRNFGEGDER
jgi:hypothetical protein